MYSLCESAVAEEPKSARIWQAFGDYIYSMWAAAFDTPDSELSFLPEEQPTAQELFTWERMINVWDRGYAQVQWHMNNSNLVWDRYMDILLQRHSSNMTTDAFRHLEGMFIARLMKPHATWDQTSSNFSTFVSTYNQAAWEETLATMNNKASQAKQQYAHREGYEFRIQKEAAAGNKAAEWDAYSQYIDWEVSLDSHNSNSQHRPSVIPTEVSLSKSVCYTVLLLRCDLDLHSCFLSFLFGNDINIFQVRHKGVFSAHLIIALYERATVRFPTIPSLWEDYVEFLIEHQLDASDSVEDVLDRATRHCPWSGDLWSHRILTLEHERRDFKQVEDVKHRATKTGLLDVGGMEELLKVYIAWCGFLRRRAFDHLSSEDDLDVAEVGIRSALEHVREIGEKKYGAEYQGMTGNVISGLAANHTSGDPLYRLERIHIKFHFQRGNIEAAREIWKTLIPRQGDNYDFWYRYYIWEMVVWAKYHMGNSIDTRLPPPHDATEVLHEALKRVATMDWPEQLTIMLSSHCEQHESVNEIRRAITKVKVANKAISKRRQ